MKILDYKDVVAEADHNALINCDEFKTVGYRYTIMYMSRVHSQAEFLFAKILALREKVFSPYETSEVFEAFSIKTICDWEWYAERIICECLKQDTSQLSKELDLSLPKTISVDESFAYLNGLGYFDLKGASNLKTIAKKILVKDKNPFDHISPEARNRIDDFYILRNYVAHRSKKAKKAASKVFVKYDQHIFEEVGLFLLSKANEKDSTIRFQDFSSSFWLASFQMMQFLYPKIYGWVTRGADVYNDECHLRFHYLRALALNQPI